MKPVRDEGLQPSFSVEASAVKLLRPHGDLVRRKRTYCAHAFDFNRQLAL